MEKNFVQTYKITSKEFWRNYWFYYKPHTIWGVVALILIISTIHSCVTRVDPDFNILYLGQYPLFTQETQQSAQTVLEQYINDVDGDGNKSVNITNMSVGNQQDAQVVQASFTKADLEIAGGDPFLFIADTTVIERYIAMGAFEPIDNIVSSANIPSERILKNPETQNAIAVDITGTNFAKIMGIVGDNKVYVGVKIKPLNKENKEDYMAFHNEVLRMFEFVIKDRL